VAGETVPIVFQCRTPGPLSQPWNAQGCTVELAVTHYGNKHGTPVLHKPGELIQEGALWSAAVVELEAEETVDWFGKYVYQVMIRDTNNDVEIPGEGFIFVTRNINKQFVSG
jgi:hypothetical protein